MASSFNSTYQGQVSAAGSLPTEGTLNMCGSLPVAGELPICAEIPLGGAPCLPLTSNINLCRLSATSVCVCLHAPGDKSHEIYSGEFPVKAQVTVEGTLRIRGFAPLQGVLPVNGSVPVSGTMPMRV